MRFYGTILFFNNKIQQLGKCSVFVLKQPFKLLKKVVVFSSEKNCLVLCCCKMKENAESYMQILGSLEVCMGQNFHAQPV